MNQILKLICIVLALCFGPTAHGQALAPDFDREARWRSEVVPTLVVGDAVDIAFAAGQRPFLGLLTPGKKDWPAIVLVHGVGVHPDFGVIGQLRVLLADAGYTTLSIQMPVLAKEVTQAAEYEKIFSFAHQRLAGAAQYLTAQGYRHHILLSHSMGSWMTNDFLRATPADANFTYSHWICLGITGRIGSTGAHRLPILDVQAENDLPAVLRARWLRKLTLGFHPKSKQIEIAQTDHYFTGREKELAKEIEVWLTESVSVQK
jgi:hypothetical protein